MSSPFSVPRGTTDILPQHIPVWHEIESKSRQLIELYGYREIRTPLFEETELFARSMGQSSDVVQKQMLNLAGQGKDAQDIQKTKLSLRPENTASVVRSYIENSYDRKEPISKFYYIGAMFRGERPQKGRLRQFHQIGVEAIGPGTFNPFLDVEVIALSLKLLEAFGLKDYQLKINTLGTEEDKKSLAQDLRKNLKKHVKSLCPDCQRRFEKNVFRLLDCKKKECQDVMDKIDYDQSFLSGPSAEYYAKVKSGLKTLNIPFTETFKLVRGLDYYTHTVFEITSSGLGSQDAVGAGGRYNNLVKDLGGAKAAAVGAVGFSLGIERIILATEKDKEVAVSSLKAYVIALDENAFTKAFQLVHLLRKEGFSSDLGYNMSSVKSQMRNADRVGAQFALLIGENEIKNQSVTVKNMKTSDQQEISLKNGSYEQLFNILRKGQ